MEDAEAFGAFLAREVAVSRELLLRLGLLDE